MVTVAILYFDFSLSVFEFVCLDEFLIVFEFVVYQIADDAGD